MTDIELTRLCAAAMKDSTSIDIDFSGRGDPYHISGGRFYNPLKDDAQAMMLVKKFHLTLMFYPTMDEWGVTGEYPAEMQCENLNRSIVETVAKMQAAKLAP